MQGARSILVVPLLLAVAGCGSPRVDSSTDDSYIASLERVRASVAEARRAEFDAAVLAISSEAIDLEGMGTGAPPDSAMAVRVRGALDGKTADEILSDASRLRAKRQAAARTGIEREIAELVARQERAFAAREALQQFEVLEARVIPVTLGKGGPMQLRVRNRTTHRVSRVYLAIVFERPDRTAPLAQRSFDLVITRELAPGASAEWTVGPEGLPWNPADAPQGARLRITVERIDDALGEPILDGRSYTEDDAARLIALQMQLTEINRDTKER